MSGAESLKSRVREIDERLKSLERELVVVSRMVGSLAKAQGYELVTKRDADGRRVVLWEKPQSRLVVL